MKKIFLALVLCFCIMFSLMPTWQATAEAAPSIPSLLYINMGAIKVEDGTATDTIKVTYNDGTVKTVDNLPMDTEIAITGATSLNSVIVNTSAKLAGNKIAKTVKITLDGAKIDFSKKYYYAAFDIQGNSVVNLKLVGSNSLKSSTQNAGLQVNTTASVTICGEGTLTATSDGYGAGIGGGFSGPSGSINRASGAITIESGTVIATGNGGAGIGGGYEGAGGTITIKGGDVTATGNSGGSGTGGAGIGGGVYGLGGKITISGGKVKARGGWCGAGIGGGAWKDGGTIVITGNAYVEANGNNAAGIGAGYYNAGAYITINGNAVVKATGGDRGAGIGASGYTLESDSGLGYDIKIGEYASVTAIGGNNGNGGSAGIGRGDQICRAGKITISGGTIVATGGNITSADAGHGIGNYYDIISISAGKVIATGNIGIYGSVKIDDTADITAVSTGGSQWDPPGAISSDITNATIGKKVANILMVIYKKPVSAKTATTVKTSNGVDLSPEITYSPDTSYKSIAFTIPKFVEGQTSENYTVYAGTAQQRHTPDSTKPSSNTFSIKAGLNKFSDVEDVPTSYTVTYDSQGATTNANPSSKTVVSPATTVVSLPTPPQKTGFTFGGWFTEINGGGTEFTSNTPVTGNITVYAKWTKTLITFYETDLFANGNAIIISSPNGNDMSNIYIDTDADGIIDAGEAPVDLSAISGNYSAPQGNTTTGFALSGSIFGGSTKALTSDTKITMLSGKVRAIYGGGYINNSTVENTNITIKGGSVNTVCATGSIDRTSVNGKATINIEGGNIRMVQLTSGWSTVGSYSLNINGGSVVNVITPAYGGTNVIAKNNNSQTLSRTALLIQGSLAPVVNTRITTTDIDIKGINYTYGLNDVFTDEQGYVYLWLPTGAVAVPKTYTVAYNGNGASGSVANQITKVGTTTTASANGFSKTGYDFTGWNTAANGTGTAYDVGASIPSQAVGTTITLYAQWTARTYTVTYDSQGATTNANPNSNNVVSPATTVGSLPTPPQKTGFNFGGWFTAINGGGTEFTSNTVVTGNITVYAKWTKIEITAQDNFLFANGNAIIISSPKGNDKSNIYIDTDADGIIDAGEEPVNLSEISGGSTTLQGDTINGFALSGCYIFGGSTKPLTGNTKITVLSGKVSEIYGGGYYITSTVENTNITIKGGSVEAVYATGYFTGVKGNATINVEGGNITRLIKLIAGTATLGSYNLNINGGSVANVSTPDYGGIDVIAKNKNSQTLYNTKLLIGEESAPVVNTRITATDIDIKGIDYTYGLNDVFTDEQGYVYLWLPTGAVAVPATYTVAYNGNGASGSVANQTTKVGTQTIVSENGFIKAGYDFTGWNTAANGTGTAYAVGESVPSQAAGTTITLYAQWTATTYTVTYDSQGATTNASPSSKTVVSPATTVVYLPTPPQKTGFIFGGWFTTINGGGTEFTSNTPVTGNITVYAKWTKIGITADLYSGYLFANGNAIIISSPKGNDMSNIYIDTDADGIIDAGEEPVNLSAISGIPTTLQGDTINGFELSWYYIFGGSTMALTGNTKITILSGKVWEIYGGGYYPTATVENTDITIKGGSVDDVCATGHFSGVKGNATINVEGGNITRHIELLSGWGTVGNYNLNINGGSVANVTTPSGGINVIAKNKNSQTLSKTALLIGEKSAPAVNTRITATDIDIKGIDYSYGLNDVFTDSQGYVYLWLPAGAVAVPATYTVAYDGNDAFGSVDTQTTNIGTTTKVSANGFYKEGYDFTGWNTAADGTGTDYAVGASIPSQAAGTKITLYAQWKEDTSTPTITIKINGTYDPTTNTIGNDGMKYSGTSLDNAISKYTAGYNQIKQLKVTTGKVTTADWQFIKYLEKMVNFEIDSAVTEVADIPNFRQNWSQPLQIQSLKIPQAISIDEYAFMLCNTLTTADFPEATTIGENAFYGCSNLKAAIYPKAATIGNYAFMYCKALTTADFTEATTIGRSAFSGCEALATVSFPRAEIIDDNAFQACKALTTVDFPEATTINVFAFSFCEALTTANFPKATTIGGAAFSGCKALTTVSFPKATTIDSQAFDKCSALVTAGFPKAIDIMDLAFSGCSSLTKLSVPLIKTFGQYTFEKCIALTTLEIGATPPSLKSGNTFSNLTQTKSLFFINEDGTELTGSALTAAQNAYKAVANVYESDMDDLWYGWKIAGSSTITYTIFYNGNGSDKGSVALQTTDVGTETIASENGFSKTGYDFTGWNTKADGKGTAYAVGSIIPSHVAGTTLTLYAQWEMERKYSVNFNAQGGTTVYSQSIRKNEKVPRLPTTNRDGFIFDGWYIEGQEILFTCNIPITEDIIVYARWTPIDQAQTYTLTYNGNGATNGSVLNQIVKSNTPTPLHANGFAKSKFIFTGWNTSADGSGTAYEKGDLISLQAVDTIVTLYAQWAAAPGTYTVIFDGNGATSGSMEAKTQATSELVYVYTNEFIKKDYEIIGWNTKADGSGTSYGKYFTYFPEGGATLEGKIIIFYAQWKYVPQIYSIEYNGNGATSGSVATQTTDIGTKTTISENGFANSGYAFIGWNTNIDGNGVTFYPGQQISIPQAGAVMRLYAQWADNSATYSVAYDGNGATGGSITTRMAKVGSETKASSNGFSKAGFTFNGWNTKADGTGIAYAVGATVPSQAAGTTITLYAQWTEIAAQTYTVVYNGNGADSGSVATQTTNVGTETPVSKNEYSKAGFTFKGWNTKADGTGTAYDVGKSVPSQVAGTTITLYAQWTATAAQTYTVVYDGNGADSGNVTTQTTNVETATIVSANGFSKTGYDFTGWNTAADGKGTAYAEGASVPSQAANTTVTLYAQWTSTAAQTYTVVYNGNGADSGSVATQTTNVGTETTVSENRFSKAGFTFKGWNTAADGKGTAYAEGASVPSQAANTTVTLYAQWTEIAAQTYTVVYDGNGADSGNVTTQTTNVGTATKVSENGFSKAGFTFKGWNTKVDGTGTTYAVGESVPSQVAGTTITLYAQWTEIAAQTYTVVYDGNGADSGNVATQTTNVGTTTKVSANGFSKTGYNFTGWNTKADGKGTAYAEGASVPSQAAGATITLYAQWTEIAAQTYTVVYNGNGADSGNVATQTTNVGTTTKVSANGFSKAGFTFKGWNTAEDGTGTAYAEGASVPSQTANTTVTLYAQWTATAAQTYTVVYDGNGADSGNVATQTTNVGTTTKVSSNGFSKTGYNFTGWNTKADGKGTAYAEGASVPSQTANTTVTLYAQWTEITAQTYNVVYNGNAADSGSVATQTTNVGKETIVSANGFSKAGFTFKGWNTAADGTGAAYAEGASVPSQVAGTTITLYAQWTATAAQTYNVVYNGNAADSGSVATQTTNVGKETIVSENGFSKAGFTFKGWNTKADGTGTAYAEGASVPSQAANTTVTLYAQWTATAAQTYTVVYDGNGADSGNVATQKTNVGTETTVSENRFSKAGYSFTGWNTEADGTGTAYAEGASVPSQAANTTVTLYAQWTEITAKTYTVVYDGNGADSGNVATQTTNVGKETIVSANGFSKAGFTFKGWNTAEDGTGTAYAEGASVPSQTANTTVTLYAQWTEMAAQTYTVVYDGNGADSGNVASQTTNVGTATIVSANGFSKTGYNFTGWNTKADGKGTAYAEGASVPSQAVNTTVTLYAQWTSTAAQTYTVVYNGNGANSGNVATQTTNVGTATIVSANGFSKTGYNFTGWNTKADGKGTAYAAGASIPSQAVGTTITLYAQWTEIAAQTYTVVYDGNGADSGNVATQTTNVGTTTKVSENGFSKTGYNFTGWNTKADGKGTAYAEGASVPSQAAGTTITLYAQWTQIAAQTYTVVYNGNGADSGSVATQTTNVGTATKVSENGFSKAGFTFKGWNTAADGTGTAYAEGASVPSQAANTTVTLYAQWTEMAAQTYTVVYNGNGADSGSVATQTTNVGKETIVSANGFSKAGFTFKGWNTAADGTGAAYAEGASVPSQVAGTTITLYAQWTATAAQTYNVVYNGNAADSGSVATQTTNVGKETIVSENGFSKTGYNFTGWNTAVDGKGTAYAVGASVPSQAAGTTITLYAQWQEITYEVIGTVQDGNSKNVLGATVKIMRGRNQIGLSVQTDTDGKFTIANVTNGTYNLVISSGTAPNEVVITKIIVVSGENYAAGTIVLPNGKTSSVVEVKENTPSVVVGNLDGQFSTIVTDNDKGVTAADQTVVTSGGAIEIKLTVEAKDDTAQNAGDIVIVSTQDGKTVGIFVDLSVMKTVVTSGSSISITNIVELPNLIDVFIPLDSSLQGKSSYVVYRYHGSAVDTITESVNAYGEKFQLVDNNTTIKLTVKKFSTYAVGYAEAAKYNLNVNINGGSGSTASGKYSSGDVISINAGSRSGYSFNGWTSSNGGTFTNANSSSTTFIMPANDTVITANWRSDSSNSGSSDRGSSDSDSSYNYYTITASATEGGTISPSGKTSVRQQSDNTFTITQDKGYIISDVLVDGKSVGAVKKYTFKDIVCDHTIKAIFAIDIKTNPETGGHNLFKDVDKNDWFFDKVLKAYEKGLIIGTSENTFSPYLETSRATITTIIYSLEGKPVGNGQNEFNDVKEGKWYSEAIAWGHENGIIFGYGDGTFKPEQNITRQEFCTILHHYAKYKGYDVSKSSKLLDFTDGKDVSNWALEQVKWAVGTEIMNGKGNGILDPKGFATRAEVCVMMLNFMDCYSK